MSQLEQRFQRITAGIELLNLLFAVDALISKNEADAEKRYAFQMALLKSGVYSKPGLAEESYQDLRQFLVDITPEDGQLREAPTELVLPGERGPRLLSFLRAVEAQKRAVQSGEAVRYTPTTCPEPGLAAKELIDALIQRLS